MEPAARDFQDPRHFRDLGRSVVQLGLFSAAVGTGGLLGAALAAGGAPAWDKVLAKFGDLGPQIFGGMAAGGLSDKLSGLVARRWSQRDATFVNHDLSSCMGAAIRECLREVASDGKRIRRDVDRKALNALADRAPRLWARIALYPGTARWTEADLQRAVAAHLAAARDAGARGATAKPIDAEAWALVLERMLRNAADRELSPAAFAATAKQLEDRSGFYFFELLKEDAANGGRRFAAGLFASLGEMRRDLPEAVSSAVAEHLDAMEDYARWRHRAVIRRIRKLDEELSAKLDEVLGKLTPELPLDEREPDDTPTVSLSKARPDAFEPDLARSLGALGSARAESDAATAAQDFEEGLRVLLPHLHRFSAAFGQLASSLARALMDACKRSGAEPNAELLAEVSKALEPQGDPG